MSDTIYTDQQLRVWLRGLLTIAWADGHYEPEEQATVSEIIHQITSIDPNSQLPLEPISSQELVGVLGHDATIAEEFVRSAVLVAIADGIYSPAEFNLIHQFSEALGLKLEVLSSLEETLCNHHPDAPTGSLTGGHVEDHSLLHPVKDWLDQMEIKDSRIARFLCKMIPAQCPFARDIKLFGHKIVHIPPMCKINPLYDQLMGLRFRALSFLADECHEDISEYIQ